MKTLKNTFKRGLVALLAVALVFSTPALASAATVTVKTQAQLNKALKALKSGEATTIRIVTDNDVTLTIPAKYDTSGVTLKVNAPNAKITNKATFKSITLGGSAVRSFTENGKNNNIKVTADTARVVVSKNAVVNKLTVSSDKANIQVNSGSQVTQVVANKENATLNLRVNGEVGTVKATAEGADVNLKGTTDKIDVVVNAKDVKVAAIVPVDVTLNEEAKVVLKDGSKGSEVEAAEGIKPDVANKSDAEVVVKTPEGETTVKAGESTANSNTTDNTGSSSTNNGSSSTNSGGSTSGGGGTPSGGNTPSNSTPLTTPEVLTIAVTVTSGSSIQTNTTVTPNGNNTVFTATGSGITLQQYNKAKVTITLKETVEGATYTASAGTVSANFTGKTATLEVSLDTLFDQYGDIAITAKKGSDSKGTWITVKVSSTGTGG